MTSMFNRYAIHTREPPASSDINYAETYLDTTLRELLRIGLRRRTGSSYSAPTAAATGTDFPGGWGFYGDGFMPVFKANMVVTLKAGLGFNVTSGDAPTAISGVIGLEDQPSFKPLVLPSDLDLTFSGGGANARIDIIEVKVNRSMDSPSSRAVFNPSTGTFDPDALNRRLHFDHTSYATVTSPSSSTATIGIKKGPEDGSVAIPAVTSGYRIIGYVYVAAGAATLDAGVVFDNRPLAFANGDDIISWQVTIGPDVNGGISAVRTFAPPGVEVALIDRKAASLAGYDVVVFAGDAGFTSASTSYYNCSLVPNQPGNTYAGAAGVVVPSVNFSPYTVAAVAADLANATLCPGGTLTKTAAAGTALSASALAVRISHHVQSDSAHSYALPSSITEYGSLRIVRNP